MHPQDATKATYLRSNGEVEWNLSEVEVHTVEYLVQEDAIEIRDIRAGGVRLVCE